MMEPTPSSEPAATPPRDSTGEPAPDRPDPTALAGPIYQYALREMEACFAHGAYIACIMTSQVVVEKLLAAHLEARGHSIEWAPLTNLAEQALAEGLLTQADVESLSRLRWIRNPYAHTRPSDHRACVGNRVRTAGVAPEILFREDARQAMQIVRDLVSREPRAGAEEKSEN